jgi:hypothetical protein
LYLTTLIVKYRKCIAYHLEVHLHRPLPSCGIYGWPAMDIEEWDEIDNIKRIRFGKVDISATR